MQIFFKCYKLASNLNKNHYLMVNQQKTIFNNFSIVNAYMCYSTKRFLKSLTSYGKYIKFSSEYKLFCINITFLNPRTFKILFSEITPNTY